MAEKKTVEKKPVEKEPVEKEPAERKPANNKSEEENLLTRLLVVWVLYFLRAYSDKENPLAKKEIANMISSLTGLGAKSLEEGKENSILKSVERCLGDLETMAYFMGEIKHGAVGEVCYRVAGGRIVVVDGKPKKYYFEPILESGDVSMICAAIESNHYLSDEEKKYLIIRESAAGSYRDGEDQYLSVVNHQPNGRKRLPAKPKGGNDPSMPPSKSSVTLKKIAILQYAIKKHYKVSVIPGRYYQEKGKIVFGPKREKESILNPYAMICQNGQYYIIVTHEGYTNPTHYRVDRLYSVKLVADNEKKHGGYVKRDDIPIKLQKFFDKNRFLTDYYIATYPLMVYKEKKDIVRCEFLCKDDAASVAIDYFGVGGSEDNTSKNTVKMSKPDKDGYVKFSVFADYNNVKFFCIQQYQIVIPVSPPELKKDVTDSLKEAIKLIDMH